MKRPMQTWPAAICKARTGSGAFVRRHWRATGDLAAVAAVGVILLAGFRSIPVAAVVVP